MKPWNSKWCLVAISASISCVFCSCYTQNVISTPVSGEISAVPASAIDALGGGSVGVAKPSRLRGSYMMEGTSKNSFMYAPFKTIGVFDALVTSNSGGATVTRLSTQNQNSLFIPDNMFPQSATFVQTDGGNSVAILNGLIPLGFHMEAKTVSGTKNGAPVDPTRWKNSNGYYGLNATSIRDMDGSLFPLVLGGRSSFTLVAKNHRGIEVTTKVSMKVVGIISDSPEKVAIPGPYYLIKVERNGGLGLPPEISSAIDWDHYGEWEGGQSTEYIFYSEKLQWPIVRAYKSPLGVKPHNANVQRDIMAFTDISAIWAVKEFHLQDSQPSGGWASAFPVDEKLSNADLLNKYYPGYLTTNPAEATGKAKTTGLTDTIEILGGVISATTMATGTAQQRQILTASNQLATIAQNWNGMSTTQLVEEVFKLSESIASGSPRGK